MAVDDIILTGTPASQSAAEASFGTLKTKVESITGSHTDTGNFLNDAQLKLAVEARNARKQDITFASGVVAFPTNCLEPLNILWDGIPLKMAGQDMYISDSTSSPTEWTVLEDDAGAKQIVLNTKISEIQVLEFIPRPAKMVSDGDTPELPDCNDALIAFARHMIYTDLENPDKAKYWFDIWQTRMGEWLKLHKKTTPVARRIKLIR